MRIMLDVDQLLEEGAITPQQAEQFRRWAVKDAGSTAINVLFAFGALAVSGSLLAFYPTAGAALFLSAAIAAGGLYIYRQHRERWGVLGSVLAIIGTFGAGGAFAGLVAHPVLSFAAVAALFLLMGAAVQSRLLVALSPLAIASIIGGSTGYFTGCYMLVIREATLTILLFSALAIAGLWVSRRVPRTHENLCLIFSRMSVILVNLGFWIGSLWGDTPGELWRLGETAMADFDAARSIPAMAFVVAWAVALIAVGAWGVKEHRRFVVNSAVTFGAIHFYTQWFELLGFHPLYVLAGGVLTIAIATGLWKYNRRVLG